MWSHNTSYGYVYTEYGCNTLTTYEWYLLNMVRMCYYTWYGHGDITHHTDIDLHCTDMIIGQRTDVMWFTPYGYHNVHLTDLNTCYLIRIWIYWLRTLSLLGADVIVNDAIRIWIRVVRMLFCTLYGLLHTDVGTLPTDITPDTIRMYTVRMTVYGCRFHVRTDLTTSVRTWSHVRSVVMSVPCAWPCDAYGTYYNVMNPYFLQEN